MEPGVARGDQTAMKRSADAGRVTKACAGTATAVPAWSRPTTSSDRARGYLGAEARHRARQSCPPGPIPIGLGAYHGGLAEPTTARWHRRRPSAGYSGLRAPCRMYRPCPARHRVASRSVQSSHELQVRCWILLCNTHRADRSPTYCHVRRPRPANQSTPANPPQTAMATAIG